MEKNSQGKNNPITKNETVADISNSSVDDNSLISRATKAVRDYLEYDFECKSVDYFQHFFQSMDNWFEYTKTCSKMRFA